MMLNKNELMIGFLYPLMFLNWLGWLVIPICPISSFLWALSGSEGQDKFWRREVCPTIVAIGLLFVTHSLCIIIGMVLSYAVMSIGYGIPSTCPVDEGSALGRFWYKITPKYADFLTRTTIYLLLYLSFRMFL